MPDTAWRWNALSTQLLGLLLIDLPALFLLFWLMRRLGASRMTARFLLAPLFTILAGMALEPASARARLARDSVRRAAQDGSLFSSGKQRGTVQACRMSAPPTCQGGRRLPIELAAFPQHAPRRPRLQENGDNNIYPPDRLIVVLAESPLPRTVIVRVSPHG
jgi:hypothetical protein